MNCAEAVDTVLSVIKRPDKTAEAGIAVNAALSRAVLKTEFARDLVETSIPLDSTLDVQTIDLTTLVAPLVRFRKWKYLKLPGATRYLKFIDPENVFVPGSFAQTDGYYTARHRLLRETQVLRAERAAALEIIGRDVVEKHGNASWPDPSIRGRVNFAPVPGLRRAENSGSGTASHRTPGR